MANITLYPDSEINVKTIFTPSSNIRIDSIKNKYNLNINFSEGDIINVGTELYIEDSLSIESLEKINNIRQNDGFVVVEYTEI
jgi:hypothetical protein